MSALIEDYALLGTAEHGRWLLSAAEPGASISRRYRDDTLILETTVDTADGTAVVIDFMPPRGQYSGIVRVVRGLRGRVRMRSDLVLRFDDGRAVPWVTRSADGRMRAVSGPHMVLLGSPAHLHGENFHTVADFEVAAGDSVPFVLTYGAAHLPAPPAIDPEKALHETEAFWHDWIRPPSSRGEWAGIVSRSLITLKALTYAPTGGIVAAPTTSVPEHLGGVRKWEYRFCWLRDATLTLLALMNAGHMSEAEAWRAWLLRAAAGAPSQVRIMYGLAAERRLGESELPWLPGYEGSTPVRLGNGAHGQQQLEVYGEVLDAMYQARLGGIASLSAAWAFERALVDHVATIWTRPDEGIWEVRGGRRHFTHSKVMAWVALDLGIKSAERFGVPADLQRWSAVRQAIHADVCAHGFDRVQHSFVQSYGAQALDASLLLLPTMGFLPASDPRVEGTVAAIERHRLRDGLVLRYDTETTDDGHPAGDGAFQPCSFWLADAYVLLGRTTEARVLFEQVVALANDLGLLAEEYDSRAGRLVGNFPQAFSHIALINTAHQPGARDQASPTACVVRARA